MEALAANAAIRNWSLNRFNKLAITEDTPRINLWFAIVDQMAERVGKDGDQKKLRDDLHDFIFKDAALQLDPHATAIKSLQDGFEELCGLLEGKATDEAADKITIKAQAKEESKS